MTSTDRTRRFRAKSAAEGWRIITVRVPANRADDVRAFAKTLGAPPAPTEPDQPTLFPQESTDV